MITEVLENLSIHRQKSAWYLSKVCRAVNVIKLPQLNYHSVFITCNPAHAVALTE